MNGEHPQRFIEGILRTRGWVFFDDLGTQLGQQETTSNMWSGHSSTLTVGTRVYDFNIVKGEEKDGLTDRQSGVSVFKKRATSNFQTVGSSVGNEVALSGGTDSRTACTCCSSTGTTWQSPCGFDSTMECGRHVDRSSCGRIWPRRSSQRRTWCRSWRTKRIGCSGRCSLTSPITRARVMPLPDAGFRGSKSPRTPDPGKLRSRRTPADAPETGYIRSAQRGGCYRFGGFAARELPSGGPGRG